MQNKQLIGSLLAAACIWPASVVAQSWHPRIVNVTVGSPEVDGNVLQPFHARWTVSSATLSDRIVSLPATDESLEPAVYKGRAAWRRVMTLSGDSTHPAATQTNYLDRRSMAPLRTNERHADGPLLLLSFEKGRISGRQKSAEKDRQIDARYRPAYDFLNGPASLILAALPLKENTEFSLPALDVDGADPGHVVRLIASVRFTEEVSVGNQKFETFVVDVPTSYGMFKYWIAKKPPYAVRWIFLGPRGGRALYTVDPASLPGQHS